ncbi:MAG: nuclear transport factor 2 family protein [Phycicoccus sp.]
MPDDHLLTDAVDTYFRALHACDVTLLDEVFHPSASLFDVDTTQVRVDPLASWRQDVATRPSPAAAGQPREDEVVQVMWLSPDCASVHVRLRVLDEIFVDHLSFVRDEGRFRIVAKTWHLERTLEP